MWRGCPGAARLYRRAPSAHDADGDGTVYHRADPSRPNDPGGCVRETCPAGDDCGCGNRRLRQFQLAQERVDDDPVDPQDHNHGHDEDGDDAEEDDAGSYHAHHSGGAGNSRHDAGRAGHAPLLAQLFSPAGQPAGPDPRSPGAGPETGSNSGSNSGPDPPEALGWRRRQDDAWLLGPDTTFPNRRGEPPPFRAFAPVRSSA